VVRLAAPDDANPTDDERGHDRAPYLPSVRAGGRRLIRDAVGEDLDRGDVRISNEALSTGACAS
jgi:hypothetical protein